MMKLSHVLTALMLLIAFLGHSQVYYGISTDTSFSVPWYLGHENYLTKLTINGNDCDGEVIGYIDTRLHDSLGINTMCLCPDNFLYAIGSQAGYNPFTNFDTTFFLFKIDPSTAATTMLIDTIPRIGSLGCRGDGKLVGMTSNSDYASSNHTGTFYYEINPNTATYTFLGNSSNVGYEWHSLFYDGYWFGVESVPPSYDFYLTKIDTTGTIPTSDALFPAPFENGFGFANYPNLCNTFLTQHYTDSTLHLFNIETQETSFLCELDTYFGGFVGMGAYDPDPHCPITFDLDPYDLSGATGTSYNTTVFDCKTNNVRIASPDVHVPPYVEIGVMTVSITSGILDPGKEALWIGLAPNLVVNGSGTTTITFTNQAGNATIADFVNALNLIQYKDIALSPTGGTREVTISFVSKNGTPSNPAISYVQVQQLPQVQVDLGTDRSICQGSSTLLDAGNPGMTYYWSSGQTTQTRLVSNPATYKVTVSDGIRCPGADELKLSVLPNITGDIDGPFLACAGDSVALVFTCNCSDTFDFEVNHNVNFSDTIFGVTDSTVLYFFLPPNPFNSLYDLNFGFLQVNTNQSNSCIGQLQHTVWVNPSNFTQDNNAFICQGDSINLGGTWHTQSGTYTHFETTPVGCGITVNTTLYVGTPGNQTIHINQNTCNPDSVGVFTQNLTGTTGCDSTVITTVSLISSDTVFISSKTCDPDSVGVFTQNLTGTTGCDSTVITTVTLAPDIFVGFHHFGAVCEGDSVGITFDILGLGSYDFRFTDLNTGQMEMLHDISYGYVHYVRPSQSALYWPQQVIGSNPDGCLDINNLLQIDVLQTIYTNNAFVLCMGDSVFVANAWQTQTGVYTDTLNTLFGCDSIVTTNLLFILPSDTVFLASQTCDPALSGVFTESLTNLAGCDSTTVTTVTLLSSDTFFIDSQTCDPALAGVFTESLNNSVGCDSTIITTVTLLSSDTVFIASQTCDPALAGVFTETLTNSAGCDSTTVTNIVLRPNDLVTLSSTTCDTALAGTSMEFLVNQYGCDSVVITTVFLLPGDTVFVASQTCDPALAGAFTQYLTNTAGCDSTIVTTISLVLSDTVFIASQTCDPALAGIFTENLLNSAGCDSTIIKTITLLSSDTVVVASQTCEPNEVGAFEEILTNQYGCDSLVLLNVSLLPTDSCEQVEPTGLEVYTPNAFSPNGDAVNDFFRLYMNEFAKRIQSLQVYSRWGERVFEAYDLSPNDPNAVWDGYFRGKLMDTGTFVFWAEILGTDGKVTIVKGEVAVVK